MKFYEELDAFSSIEAQRDLQFRRLTFFYLAVGASPVSCYLHNVSYRMLEKCRMLESSVYIQCTYIFCFVLHVSAVLLVKTFFFSFFCFFLFILASHFQKSMAKFILGRYLFTINHNPFIMFSIQACVRSRQHSVMQ